MMRERTCALIKIVEHRYKYPMERKLLCITPIWLHSLPDIVLAECRQEHIQFSNGDLRNIPPTDKRSCRISTLQCSALRTLLAAKAEYNIFVHNAFHYVTGQTLIYYSVELGRSDF